MDLREIGLSPLVNSFAIPLMMVASLSVSSQADSPRKHRGPCEIHYPSDATLEGDCLVIPPGESLETIFGEYWVDIARFNRIDRRHARPGLSIKVPRQFEGLAKFTPLPLVYPPGERNEKFILIDLTSNFSEPINSEPFASRLPSRPRMDPTKRLRGRSV